MKPAILISAAALLALIWAAPLGAFLPAFALHMLRHMTLVALAAPLIVLGLPRVFAGARVSPLGAALVEFAVVWGWHLPAAHAIGRLGAAGLALEQASFLAAGVMVWAGCLRPDQPLAGAGGLLVTSMHMTLLGALLVLAPRDIYAGICGTAPDLTGQQIGGMLMLAIGTPVYLLAGLWLTAQALNDRRIA